MDKIAEFDFLSDFVAENCFDVEVCRDQLRVLWTAFCLHHGLIVDTHNYDLHLLKLWQEIQKTGDGTSEWLTSTVLKISCALIWYEHLEIFMQIKSCVSVQSSYDRSVA